MDVGWVSNVCWHSSSFRRTTHRCAWAGIYHSVAHSRESSIIQVKPWETYRPNPVKLRVMEPCWLILCHPLGLSFLFIASTPPSLHPAHPSVETASNVSHMLAHLGGFCSSFLWWFDHLAPPHPLDHFGYGLFLVLDGLIVKGVLWISK